MLSRRMVIYLPRHLALYNSVHNDPHKPSYASLFWEKTVTPFKSAYTSLKREFPLLARENSDIVPLLCQTSSIDYNTSTESITLRLGPEIKWC